MSQTPKAVRAVIPGILKRTSFKTEQERLEAFCEAMSISAQAGEPGRDGKGTKGDKGDQGSAPTTNVKIVDIPVASTSVDCGISVESHPVNLVNNTETPTIGILAISGSVVFFTEAAPTGNYKLKVII